MRENSSLLASRPQEFLCQNPPRGTAAGSPRRGGAGRKKGRHEVPPFSPARATARARARRSPYSVTVNSTVQTSVFQFQIQVQEPAPVVEGVTS